MDLLAVGAPRRPTRRLEAKAPDRTTRKNPSVRLPRGSSFPQIEGLNVQGPGPEYVGLPDRTLIEGK